MPRYSMLAPMTGRWPRTLSRAYGFSGPQEMAESLPEAAHVADFGAGMSKLGHAITAAREDVAWINVDTHTGLFNFAQRQQRKSSPGLQYIQASVLKPPIAPASLDRVYSSWLLPHIILESEDLALGAIHAMAQLLRSDGEISTCNPNGRKHPRNITVTAEEYHQAPDEAAYAILETSRLGPIESIIGRAQGLASLALGLDRLP